MRRESVTQTSPCFDRERVGDARSDWGYYSTHKYRSTTTLGSRRIDKRKKNFTSIFMQLQRLLSVPSNSTPKLSSCIVFSSHSIRSPNFVFIIFSLDFIDEVVLVLQRGLVHIFNSLTSVDLTYFSFILFPHWRKLATAAFDTIWRFAWLWLVVLSFIDIFGATAIKQCIQMKLFIKFFDSDDAFSWAKAPLRWMGLVNGIIGRENILQSNPIY